MSSRSTALIATPEQTEQAKTLLAATSAERSSLRAESAGGSRPLPRELGQVLDAVLHALAEGGSVTVQSMPQQLTTTQAADLLGISRPTLMKRIHEGEIDSTLVGTHHRLRTSDVLRLRDAAQAERRAAALKILALEDEHDL